MARHPEVTQAVDAPYHAFIAYKVQTPVGFMEFVKNGGRSRPNLFIRALTVCVG